MFANFTREGNLELETEHSCGLLATIHANGLGVYPGWTAARTPAGTRHSVDRRSAAMPYGNCNVRATVMAPDQRRLAARSAREADL
jgi:hypothetical protein